MFGLTIVRKRYLEELEDTITNYENRDIYKERKLRKAIGVLKRISDTSKKMNKTDIVALCVDLFKEIR